LWIHDDLDLDSLDLDEELAKLEREELQLSQEFLALERAPREADRLLGIRDDHGPERHDERWAEALLQEETRRPATPPAKAKAKTETAPPVAKPVPVPSAPAPAPAPARPVAERPEPVLRAEKLAPLPALHAEPEDAPRMVPDETPAPRLLHEPALRDEGLRTLSEEPLHLDWQAPKKPWGRWIGWTLLNVLGLLALTGQYVWYHFGELARQEQYRSWFEQVCPEIGCQLPSRVDIDLIKSSNLVVRSHPEFSGALVVDAILYNRASFAQPFPLLELRFADLNGRLLASRRFQPGEYLGGELAGQSEMPPQTPIHISLDILDPGAQAVNYSLSFHSPD